jgi:hypothetical protein
VQAISASNDANRFGTAHVVRFALRERSELRQTSGSSTIAIPLVSILNPEHVLEKVPSLPLTAHCQSLFIRCSVHHCPSLSVTAHHDLLRCNRTRWLEVAAVISCLRRLQLPRKPALKLPPLRRHQCRGQTKELQLHFRCQLGDGQRRLSH